MNIWEKVIPDRGKRQWKSARGGTQASTYEEQCDGRRVWQNMIAGEVGYEMVREVGTRTHRAFRAIWARVGDFDFLRVSHQRAFSREDPCLFRRPEPRSPNVSGVAPILHKGEPLPQNHSNRTWPPWTTLCTQGNSHNCSPHRCT